MVTVVSVIDGCIDNRVNERDWQRGGGGGGRSLFIHNVM